MMSSPSDVLHCDVLVVGAGSSGVTAAHGAMQAGAKVLLADSLAWLGGLSTNGLIGTICGLYRSGQGMDAQVDVRGPARTLAESLIKISGYQSESFGPHTFLPYDPSALAELYRSLLRGVTVRLGTSVTAVASKSRSLTCAQMISGTNHVKVHFGSLVDCSGQGVISHLLQAPMQSDPEQAGAFSFMMRPRSNSPIRAQLTAAFRTVFQAVDRQELSPVCRKLNFVPQSSATRPVILKLALLTQPTPMTLLEARDAAEQISSLLNEQLGWQVTGYSRMLGQRSNPISLARYQLRESDVLDAAKHEDGVAAGLWPMEFWPSDGGKVVLTELPSHGYYQIPARSLQSAHYDNLWLAGRCIGAEPNALASARVIGTCWQTGYAAGRLAAAQAVGQPYDRVVRALKLQQGDLEHRAVHKRSDYDVFL